MELERLRDPQRVAEAAKRQGLVIPLGPGVPRPGAPARSPATWRRLLAESDTKITAPPPARPPELDPDPIRLETRGGSAQTRDGVGTQEGPDEKPRWGQRDHAAATTTGAGERAADEETTRATYRHRAPPRARAARAGQGLPARPAPGRVRADRDGALGLLRAAGAAPGHRPEVLRADGGRRGHGRRGAAGHPRRHPGPQRRAARRLGRRADGGGRPADDGRPRAGDRHLPLQAPATSTTSAPSSGSASRTAGSSTSPARCPRPQANEVVDAAEELGYEGLSTRRDPVRSYPARDVAANLVGFLGTPRKNGAARALAGLEDTFNGYLAGTDGEARYEVGAGNRIPLGDNTVTQAVDGDDLTTTIDRDLQWYAQRVLRQTVLGARGDSGHAVIMDSRTGELLTVADYPTYDASDPYASADNDEPLQVGGAHRRLRARLGREGAHPQLAHRRRQGHQPDPVPGARGAGAAGPADPRLLGARPDQPHPRRHRRQVVQHRHGARVPTSSVGGSCAATSPGSGSASAPTSASAARPRACCPPGSCGPTRPRTGSRSARASRSTPCRWPRR